MDRDEVDEFVSYLDYKTERVKIKDTINYIDRLLNTYKLNANPTNYFNKQIVDDSIFTKYKEKYRSTSFFNTRRTKRIDLAVLFYIYFELYLKYEMPDKYDIVNIYITTDDFRSEKCKPKRGIIANLTPPYEELGNGFLPDSRMNSYEFQHYYYPQQKEMENLFWLYKKWINEVKKHGSLEVARKKGLSPFKKTKFKWAINYYSKETLKYRNSFFPRHKPHRNRNKSNSNLCVEIYTKEWGSSFCDKNTD